MAIFVALTDNLEWPVARSVVHHGTGSDGILIALSGPGHNHLLRWRGIGFVLQGQAKARDRLTQRGLPSKMSFQ